jgi:hypothetical protein
LWGARHTTALSGRGRLAEIITEIIVLQRDADSRIRSPT